MEALGPSNISGIVSGLDTNAIVDAIMAAERSNAVLLEVRQAETTNMISAYRAVEAKFLAIQAQLGSLTRSSTFTRGTFSVSDPDGLDVAASGSVAPGTFDVRVLELARNHQLASQGIDDPDNTVLGTGDFKISVGAGSQQTIEVDSTNNTLEGLRQAINRADAGVTATIVNDGTTVNSNRLVLTAKDTGAKNTISVQSTLTGGVNPDFATSSFDTPETDGFSALATSAVTLGPTAAYTGSQNKTYTFTVAGTGTQIVGTDSITINYTDGTDTGSIVVNQADTEVALTGAGSDGLTLSFSAGDLVAGDTFTVSTFSPILQKPSDARISIGSSDGGGAPIEVISASNVFRGALPGMNLTAKQVTEAGKSITVTAENDINGITGDINSFISAYNDAMEFIDKQFSFNQETKESGVLITEALLRSMQTSVRLGAIDVVGNLESDINALATIGIRTDAQGSMRITDATLLQDAIKNNTESLQKLFGDSISGNRTEFQLISAASETRAGANNVVDITQAARQASYEGTAIADPALQPLTINSGANTLKLRIGSVDSEDIVLTAGTYTSFTQLVKEIQTRIDADDKIGARNLVVSFTKTGDTGRIKITGGEYGSNTTVDIVLGSSDALETSLGLKNGDIVTGLDVAGTINGEKATGSGQTLTGNSGNKTTDGLKLKITLTESDIVTGSEGVFTLSRGVASRLKSALFLITDSINGSLSSRVKALDSQVSDIKDQVKRIDERLALRRESLVKRFLKMEQALNQFNAQGAFLTSGLAALSRSFGQ